MKFFLTLGAALILLTAPASAQDTPPDETAPAPVHGLAMHGDLKYGPDFTHFEYANPDAPKGGTLRHWGSETFDNLNPHIPRGVAAAGLNLTTVSLLEGSADEPFSTYGGLAESLEVPEDRSWVIFNLRPEAVWHDGEPITAHDVVFSLDTLISKGYPFYGSYYANVESVEALSDHRVKFTFDMADNRELPLIAGQLTILPRHYWEAEGRDFSASTLTPPPGNGPYRIGRIVPGRSIEYVRVTDWWGKDLPVYKGRFNFDRITYEYFRDQTVSLEALFAGQYDYRQEYTAKLWATAYDAPPVRDGRIIKKTIENELPQGFQGFIYNLRRPLFQDRVLRRALDYAFDYEWSNKNFAYDAYTRTRSYFSNSEMEADGLPEGKELEILERFRGQIPEEVFTEEYNPAKSDGSGRNRENLRIARDMLAEAGYVINADGALIHEETGRKVEFEMLFSNINAAFEKWFQPFRDNLERLGITARIRIVDASQYINRTMAFDYDMVVASFGQSNSPGNEQREYWGSDKADQPGSRNLIGVQDPVVDELVDLIVSAPTREDLVARTRALDRVLQWGFYSIPNWHIPAWRVAYWDKFGQPEFQAPFALGVSDTWWHKDAE